MKQKIILFFSILCLLLAFFPLRGKAVEQSDEAHILLRDLCSKIRTVKPLENGNRADKAVWDDTSSYLLQRYGSGSKKDLPSGVPHTDGSSTWSTSALQGKHSRSIQATWDKAKSKLYVTIKGNAKGSQLGKIKERVGEYIIRINADVVEEKDKQGNAVLRTRLPKTGAVEAFAVGCDEKEQVDLNGTWTDNLGREWIIKHPPLACTDQQAQITLERTNENNYKIVHQGTMSNWTINANHNIIHPDAVTEPEPLWVRRVIASGEKGRASFVLSLSPHRTEDGTLSLEGTFTGFNVTWNPDEKAVRKVFPSYETPITLNREEMARVVSIEIVKPEPPFSPFGSVIVKDSYRFRVKVILKGNPQVKTQPVTIKCIANGTEKQVLAEKTENPLVYITQPILVFPPCTFDVKPEVEL